MKNLKKVVVAIAFLSTTAFANNVNCSLKTSSGEVRTINHQVSNEGHGPINPYDLEVYQGMVSSSKGHLVVSIYNKLTNVSSSFYGKVSESTGLGGQVSDGSDWIQVECSK